MTNNRTVVILVTRRISRDEEYPVFNLSTGEDELAGVEIDIPLELAQRYEAAKAEWDAVQVALDQAWKP